MLLAEVKPLEGISSGDEDFRFDWTTVLTLLSVNQLTDLEIIKSLHSLRSGTGLKHLQPQTQLQGQEDRQLTRTKDTTCLCWADW